jgi:hypothetical protein
MSVVRSLSAFVPHDLTAPLSGAGAGPLAGLSAAVKDMYDFTGYRTGGGSPDWLDAQAPATSTAAAVVRILNAGATIIGKTVCDEFFYSVSGANTHYGTPINPRAPNRLPRDPSVLQQPWKFVDERLGDFCRRGQQVGRHPGEHHTGLPDRKKDENAGNRGQHSHKHDACSSGSVRL